MSDAAPPPPDPAPQHKSWASNPWLWAVVGLGVIVMGLAIWGLNERSNADDAKADVKAQKAQPAKTTTVSQTDTVTEQAKPPTATTDSGGDDEQRVHVGAIAAATAGFAAARKQLNESEAQVAELEKQVDDANDEAKDAQQDADKAKDQAENASDAQKKAEAEADQAEAEKRQLGAKAKAAAGCAKGMLEIAVEIPKAGSLDEGMQQAGEDMKAFAPKCKDSVASAGE